MREVRALGLVVTQVAFVAALAVSVEAHGAPGGPHGEGGGGRATAVTGSAPSAVPEPGAGTGQGQFSSSSAPPGLSPFIVGNSLCPLPGDVWRELVTLIPAERLIAYQTTHAPTTAGASVGAAEPPSPAVEIADLGEKYRVIVGGRVREYRNGGRDCAYRARVAAVFVALTVDPAAVAVEPPPPPAFAAPAAPPPAATQPVEPPPAGTVELLAKSSVERFVERFAELEVGLARDFAKGSGPHTTHNGAGLRLAFGRGPLALVIGASIFTTAHGTIGESQLTQRHDPLDLGLRIRWQELFFEPYAETGVGLALLSEKGSGFPMNYSNTIVEIGVFAAAGMRLPARSRVAFYLSGRGEWIPKPAELQALPDGKLGQAPQYWIGVTAGVSVRL